MRRHPAGAIAALALLAACSSGPSAPAGWQPVAGATTTWSNGSGATLQTYTYAKKSFNGTLQELASQQAVDVVLRRRGAKFTQSTTFAPCPGMAAIASFTLGTDRLLEQGFAVQSDRAVLVTYVRPKSATFDPAVSKAMESALCASGL